MTIKQLIEELQKYDPNMIVITESQDDSYSPAPSTRKFAFKYNYWDEKHQIQSVPENQEFVTL